MITGDFDTQESDIPFPVFPDLIGEKVGDPTGEPVSRADSPANIEPEKDVPLGQDEKSKQMVEFLASENFSNRDKYVRMHILLLTWVIRRKIIENIKRVFDFVLSMFLIILFSPVMLLTALIIKLESPGPILYKQERVGIWGKPFLCYKFRSMVDDADLRKAELMDLNEADQVIFKIKKDPRITRVGQFFRKLSIDELPQLFNVIKGEMSLVGPRPENLYRFNLHKALQGARLAIRPGLTGLAQIRKSYDLKPGHKVKYDYLYIQKRSLLFNLYILLKTVPVVLFKKGS